MRGAPVGLLAVVALLSGCSDGGSAEQACTLIGSESGVSVEVSADLAPVRGLVLTVCSDGECTDGRVGLRPGTSVASEGCDGTGPDAVCSAEVTPDGTQYGFVSTELTDGPVQVSATYRQDGATVVLEAVEVRARTTYPNGPDCGAGGVQAVVTMGPGGLDGSP